MRDAQDLDKHERILLHVITASNELIHLGDREIARSRKFALKNHKDMINPRRREAI